MKRMIKKLAVATILTVMAMTTLTGCNKYASHYKTTICVTENDSDSASLSFSTFEGTRSFNLKCDNAGETLKFTGKLDKGAATVYYDDDGTKKELFTIKGGETTDSQIDGLSDGKLYIIIETDGKCETGSFDFELN